ncbi:DNA-binding protein [Duganella sp. CT11-25]|uniref:DNA-binding protein n=1 Tax=unclassified Duganella TaxID=2636909 RepID=UPI0039B08758
MARTGLSKSEVRASRDQLLAEGRYPSVDAVRAALGTGSKSTIHKYLKELGSEDAGAGMKREDTARTLLGVVEQLADQLHGDAERRLESMRAEYERELAQLRDTVARLSARVEELEQGKLAPGGLANQLEEPVSNGFGHFCNFQSSSRSGRLEDSPFSVILSGGRSAIFDLDTLQVAGQIQLRPRVYPG